MCVCVCVCCESEKKLQAVGQTWPQVMRVGDVFGRVVDSTSSSVFVGTSCV